MLGADEVAGRVVAHSTALSCRSTLRCQPALTHQLPPGPRGRDHKGCLSCSDSCCWLAPDSTSGVSCHNVVGEGRQSFLCSCTASRSTGSCWGRSQRGPKTITTWAAAQTVDAARCWQTACALAPEARRHIGSGAAAVDRTASA
uniref:Uncharacterized protein n=1 Tax=Tetradesmus obliquus TaxID=3088 RepID=A0A383WLZ5_TETOB